MYGRMYSQFGQENLRQKHTLVKVGDAVVAEPSEEKEINFFVYSSKSLDIPTRVIVAKAGW